METVIVLRKSARYETLIMSVGLILTAIACARLRGEMEILPVSLCFLFAAFAQIGGNFANCYYDAELHFGDGIDARMRESGQRANENAIVQVSGIAAQGSLLLSATIGMALLMISGWWTLIPAAIIYGLIFLNFGSSHPISRTPWAPIVPFVSFGVIGIGASAMIQIFYDNPDPFGWYYLAPCVFSSTAMGFLAANVLLIHGFNSMDRDAQNLKRSFSLRFGRKGTIATVFFSGMAYMTLMAIFAFSQFVSHPWIALIIAVIPMLFTLWVCVRMSRQKEDDLSDRNASLAMWIYFLAGLLSCIFAFLYGDSDRSSIMFMT